METTTGQAYAWHRWHGKIDHWASHRPHSSKNGTWVTGCHRKIGQVSPIEEELWAFARWPKLARSLNLKGIEVAIDASAAIDMGKFSVLHHFSNVISDCNFLMAELDIPTISHTYREGNQCADLLANLSVKAMKRRISWSFVTLHLVFSRIS